MIELTKIDGSPITINAEEIESLESHHDTTITLRSGRRMLVKENAALITELVIKYKQKCYLNLKNTGDEKRT